MALEISKSFSLFDSFENIKVCTLLVSNESLRSLFKEAQAFAKDHYSKLGGQTIHYVCCRGFNNIEKLHEFFALVAYRLFHNSFKNIDNLEDRLLVSTRIYPKNATLCIYSESNITAEDLAAIIVFSNSSFSITLSGQEESTTVRVGSQATLRLQGFEAHTTSIHLTTYEDIAFVTLFKFCII